MFGNEKKFKSLLESTLAVWGRRWLGKGREEKEDNVPMPLQILGKPTAAFLLSTSSSWILFLCLFFCVSLTSDAACKKENYCLFTIHELLTKYTYCPSLGPQGPSRAPTDINERAYVSVHWLCASDDQTGGVMAWRFVRHDHTKPCRGDSVADCQVWPSKAIARGCHDMVTCCQVARYDSWKP